MSGIPDPAFKSIPKTSTAFIIWRIENLQVATIPKDQYGNFYEGDSYIIYAASEYGKPCGVDTKPVHVNGSLEVHIHFWLGAETTPDEAGVAAFKTVELDDFLGGGPIQHREVQGNESARFKAYFKAGMRVLKGGVASGFNHVTDSFDPRLFHIKGHRSPTTTQLRSVSWEHFNSGDVFILDTKEVIFVWVGQTANKMEKLQAAKVATQFRDEHGATSIVFVDDGKEQNLHATDRKVFSSFLDLNQRVVKAAEVAGGDEEQEKVSRGALTLYHCCDEGGTYKVTEVKSGPLHQSDLNIDDSFIVDNAAAGIWVWVGRRASPKERVEAMRNAHGYVTKKGYPTNTAVTRVVDGGEPVEFKMLFSSWKEKNQTMGTGKQNTVGRIAMTVHTKFDATTLHEKPKLAAESQLVDDGSGQCEVWRVENFNLVEVPEKLHGVFFSGDSYIVKYSYTAGSSEKHILYYWLGLHSPADERGTAALKTVELDDAMGGAAVQVRVVQGKEPAHFLTIFKGSMIILTGGKASAFEGEEACDAEIPNSLLLQVYGNQTHNTRAVQVELEASSLNTNDVFVLKNEELGCFLWCGKGSTGDEREMAKNVATIMSMGEYDVVYEGQEKADFWEAIGGKEEYSTSKRLADPSDSMPARLFQCSNASGSFKAEEIVNFTQTDLTPEDVMLLDAQDAIYTWVGQFSNKEERELSIITAVEYLQSDPANRDEDTPILQIKQGNEPPTFTGFFGAWDVQLWKEYKSYETMRCELEGRKPIVQIDTNMATEEKDFNNFPKYNVDLLRESLENLPEDVDKTKREMHLTSDDFEGVFGMPYEEFAALAKWKQHNLKKSAGLY